MTRDQQIIIDKLVDAARQVMHHDADPDSAVWTYEVKTLGEKFYAILFDSPNARLLRRLAARSRSKAPSR